MRRNIFILTCLALINLSCERNLNPTPSQNDIYITKFDMEAMRKKHLPNFDLVKRRPMWDFGREFVHEKINSEDDLFIVVGLHASPKNVEVIALNYLSEISIVMSEGPINGLSIGDRLWWWWSPTSDSKNVTNIVFTRKNALFILNSPKYDRLVYLAESIDEDIVNGASYIKKSNAISFPKILSITTSKAELREGESTKITVTASEPDNEPLDYVFNFGLSHAEPDPENVFTFKASHDYVAEPFWGSHILKFIVFNESNVISEVAELEIKISQ